MDEPGEGGGSGFPGLVELRIRNVRRVPAVDLQDDHAVGERPEGSSEVGLAGGEEERLSRPVLQPRCQVLPGESPGSGQPVEVGLGEAEPPVGRQQVPGGIDRVVSSLERGMQGGADVAEGLLDQRNLDGLLARQVLVEGGRPDGALFW